MLSPKHFLRYSTLVILFLVFSFPAWADSIVTIDVNASFLAPIPGSNANAVNFSSTPLFSLTGAILYDVTSGEAMQMNLTLATSGGATYQFTGQNAGSCGFVDCFFQGRDPTVSVSLYTPFFFLGLPAFNVGDQFAACPALDTFFADGTSALAFPCRQTSLVVFNGVTGVVYTPENGTSSGEFTVVASPEPNTFLLLGCGLVLLLVLLVPRSKSFNGGRADVLPTVSDGIARGRTTLF